MHAVYNIYMHAYIYVYTLIFPLGAQSTMNINAFRGSYVGSYTTSGLHGSMGRSHH